MYNIAFHFFDDHQLNIDVEDDLLDSFLEDIGQNTKTNQLAFGSKGKRSDTLKSIGYNGIKSRQARRAN